MTVSKEQAQAALNWFNKATNHNTKVQEVQTIRTVLQECLDMVNGFSEGELRTMMRDPKYWRDKDPDMIEQVRKGWEIVFGKPSQPSEALAALSATDTNVATKTHADTSEALDAFGRVTCVALGRPYNKDVFDADVRVIEAALQRNDVPQWQPIETAPRDNSLFVGYNPKEDNYFVCKWRDYHHDSQAGKSYLLGEGRRGSFYSEWESSYRQSAIEVKPTHWMPLPAAPKQGE